MSCNLPMFSKCCFCIPLRPGLLVLAYLRLIIAILALPGLLVAVHVQFSAKGLVILLALLGLLVANLAFSIVFIVGIHQKNYRLLRVYFSFSVFFMVLSVLLLLFALGLQAYVSIYYDAWTVFSDNIVRSLSSVVDICAILTRYLPFQRNWVMASISVLPFFCYLVIQLYFIAVIRSEILKLKSEKKVQYMKSNGEARVVLDMPIVKECDVKCDVVYSDSELEEELALKKPLFPVDELKRLQLEMEVKKV